MPVYYITLVCPTLERTMEMAEKYIERGARALQFDMPSRDPSYETPLVREMMANALEEYDGYSAYMEALCALKRRRPEVELHLVVYPDVVESIGEQAFCDFCRRAQLASIMPAVPCQSLEQSLSEDGLPLLTMAGNNLDERMLGRLKALADDKIAVVNYKRPIAIMGDTYADFTEKLRCLRTLGVSSRLFAVEGVTDERMMREVRNAGASGAFVGNVLMQLWDDPLALWGKFDSFQALMTADEQGKEEHNEI